MARQATLELVGDASRLVKSLDDAGKQSQTFGDKIRDAGKKMTAFATVPIVAFLGAATKAAAEDEQAQAQLAKTLQNTTGASKAVVAGVEEQISAWMRASTFADDQLRPALENLVRVTGNVGEAEKQMATAMDIAAATGKDLGTVTEAMARANLGNVGSLSRLGIATKDTEGKTLSFEQVMANANKTYGGAAQAALDTTAGRTQALKRDMGELTEQMGSALIPILGKVIGWVAPLIEKFSGMSSGTQTMILVVAGLVAVIGPLIGVVTALSTVMAFLAANPITLVIAAVAALIAGLVYAYKNSETFRNIIDGAFRAVRTAVETMWRVVEPILGVYIDYLKTLWGIAGKVAGVVGKIGGGIGGVIGKIPGFQSGGIVPGPAGAARLAVVHGGEHITPRYRTGGGGGTTIIINVSGVGMGRDFGNAVAQAIRDNRLIGVT